MLHAVIVAHPRPDSFVGQMAAAYVGAVEAMGHEADVRDLYRLGFDPCLKADEIPAESGFEARKDVQLERARLDCADVVALIYPLWFNGPPAMMKGYVDRVFGMGFGYEATLGGVAPRLGAKRLISFTSSGAPDDWFRQTGAMDSLLALFDLHLCQVTGMVFMDHVNIGGVVPGLRPDIVQGRMDGVAAAVRKAFQAPTPAGASVVSLRGGA